MDLLSCKNDYLQYLLEIQYGYFNNHLSNGDLIAASNVSSIIDHIKILIDRNVKNDINNDIDKNDIDKNNKKK